MLRRSTMTPMSCAHAVVVLLIAVTVSSNSAVTNYTKPAGTCDYPGNNANSLTNFTGNWVNTGTLITYACDAGYRMFGGSEHRTCLHNGTWSLEAPICAQQVSFGKNITCTSQSCQPTDSNIIVHIIDDNDDTCANVKSTRVADVTTFKLDLLEHFAVRVFRLVLRGAAAQYVNPRIMLGNDPYAESELFPSECIITKETLQPKGDGYVMTIRPNIARNARYVNIYVNHRAPNEEFSLCEVQVYAEDALSFHQCFNPSGLHDTSGAAHGSFQPGGAGGTKGSWPPTSASAVAALRNTIQHRGQCYTLESKLALEWKDHREQCHAAYQGELIHDITEDTNQALVSYVQVKGAVNNYWLGGYTETMPTPSGKPEFVPMWISGNQIRVPFLEAKPDHCLAFAAPKGIWMFFPCYYRTGSICQSRVKRCGSLPLSEHMTATQPWRTEVGVVNAHRCPSGFGLLGSESRTCQQDGRWSGIAPTCIFGGTSQDKYTMTAIIGVVAGIIFGILLLVLIFYIIMRKQGGFRHKMSVGKSQSVEALECGERKDNGGGKKERSSLNSGAKGGQNYDSLVQEKDQTTKR